LKYEYYYLIGLVMCRFCCGWKNNQL